jgi:geranylgeranyl pyrophosphate synthase
LINHIERLWAGSGASSELIYLMRLAVSADGEKKESSGDLSRWKNLPGLCCQAAGGHPEWAGDLAAAWVLFYIAAHLMDKIQDQDEPDPWWRERGTGSALSAATGLFFTASLAINQLNTDPKSARVAADIIQAFNHSFLWMASGQYLDMLGPARTLQQYWDRAMAKSGSFFGLACRTGAQLAVGETERLAAFERYGQHLGLLIQIKDDLDDLQPPKAVDAYGQNPGLINSLPVVYSFDVFQPELRHRLQQLLAAAPDDAQAAQEVIDLLDQSGAAVYLLTEMERHQYLAIQAIQEAAPPSDARVQLEALINGLAISAR